MVNEQQRRDTLYFESGVNEREAALLLHIESLCGAVMRALSKVKRTKGDVPVSTLTDALAKLTLSHVRQGYEVGDRFQEILDGLDSEAVHQRARFEDLEAACAKQDAQIKNLLRENDILVRRLNALEGRIK